MEVTRSDEFGAGVARRIAEPSPLVPPRREAYDLGNSTAPALLILASASLVASALVRMARVVDRARSLASIAQEGTWGKAGLDPVRLRLWLARHERRARYVEVSIGTLYAAIVVFVGAYLAIAVDRLVGDSLN